MRLLDRINDFENFSQYEIIKIKNEVVITTYRQILSLKNSP